MTRLLIVVALVWIALMPPLFTHGACTAEYEDVENLLNQNPERLHTPALAAQFLHDHGIAVVTMTPDDCAQSKPRFINQCPSGTLVYADVPVHNKICSIYRDDKTQIQLQYDRRDRLARVSSEMKPYKFYPLPWGGQVEWAK